MTRLPWEVLELLPLREKSIGERERERRRWCSPCSLLRDETDGWRWIEVPEWDCDMFGELELDTSTFFFPAMGDCGFESEGFGGACCCCC